MTDPRWDWAEVTALGDQEPRYVKVRCNHLETVPVESLVTGEMLATLCLTCDAQLEAHHRPERGMDESDMAEVDTLICAYEHADTDEKGRIRQRVMDLTDGLF